MFSGFSKMETSPFGSKGLIVTPRLRHEKLLLAKLPQPLQKYADLKDQKILELGKSLKKIRFDSQGRVIKRTIVGSGDEYERSK